jgi:hypothetical protein
MANLGNNYSADPNEKEQEFELLPAGEYKAIITESDYINNKKGTGMILKLTYKIIDGPLKERIVFENLSLEHQNEKTRVIAKSSLNAIMVAVGIPKLTDSSQLHNKPMLIKIKAVPAKDGYEPSNRITKHSSINAGVASVPPIGNAPVQNGAPLQPWEQQQ